jgi:hypothetical protein
MYRGGKLSCWALDSGVPMEKVAGIDGRRWWVQVDNMEVGVAGLCIHQHGAGGRVLGQKPETKLLWLGFWAAVARWVVPC